MDDFGKYEKMRDVGASPINVYFAAKADGFNEIECIRLLRKVFNLSLGQVKEIRLASKGFTGSVEEYEKKLLPGLEKALNSMSEDNDE